MFKLNTDKLAIYSVNQAFPKTADPTNLTKYSKQQIGKHEFQHDCLLPCTDNKQPARYSH